MAVWHSSFLQQKMYYILCSTCQKLVYFDNVFPCAKFVSKWKSETDSTTSVKLVFSSQFSSQNLPEWHVLFAKMILPTHWGLELDIHGGICKSAILCNGISWTREVHSRQLSCSGNPIGKGLVTPEIIKYTLRQISKLAWKFKLSVRKTSVFEWK